MAGIGNAIEPGRNATLSRVTGQPMLAGIVWFLLAPTSFLVGMVVVRRLDVPSARTMAQAPWWTWPGGMLDAAVVLAQLYMSERMGAAPFLGLVVTGGVIASIILDHFGLVGFERHRASWQRLADGASMIVGVTLVSLF